MKKILFAICLLLVVAAFSGCVGKGFVLGSPDSIATSNFDAAVTGFSANMSRTLEASEISYIDENNYTYEYYNTLYFQNEINYTEYIAIVQALIFQGFANLTSPPVVALPIMQPEQYAAQIPIPIPISEVLREPAGYVAITFDDGPHPTLTPLLLDALYARNIRATFFLLGAAVDNNPNIVARMYAEGHSIGNHSYRHPRFTAMDRTRIMNEIESTNRSIMNITGSLPTLLRPPYGAQNNMVIDVARQMDMSVVLWSVDPRDWDHRNAVIVRDNILNMTIDGSVVLLHDIHETSIEAAVMAIDALVDRGYEFVTVEELFELSDLTLQAGQIYRSIYHSLGTR